MTETQTYRCVHYTDHVRCTADATRRLLDPYGRGSSCDIYCREHAQAIMDEYWDKFGWYWTMQPLEEEL